MNQWVFLILKAKILMLSAKVQARVEQRLKSHELTEAFATNEFVWFAVFVFSLSSRKYFWYFNLSPLLITQNLFTSGFCVVGVTHLLCIQSALFPFLVSLLINSLNFSCIVDLEIIVIFHIVVYCSTNTKKPVTHPHHHGRRKTKRSHHTDKWIHCSTPSELKFSVIR